ncbi:MAG: hypothetical protein WCI57_00730 [Candidatus Berkelbacteria bacterium]
MTTINLDKNAKVQTSLLVDITIESTLPELQGSRVTITRISSPKRRRQFTAIVKKQNGEELNLSRLDYFPLIVGTVIGELLDCPITIRLHDIGQLREGYHAVVTATSSLFGKEEQKSESVDKLGCVAMTKAAVKATEALFAGKD